MIMAKLHTMPIVKQINEEFPQGARDYVPLYQHVDDMTNLFTANNAAVMTETVVTYAVRMAELLTKRGLTVSEKLRSYPSMLSLKLLVKDLSPRGYPCRSTGPIWTLVCR